MKNKNTIKNINLCNKIEGTKIALISIMIKF